MVTEYVQASPNRARRAEISRGVRLLASGIGMFSWARIRTPGQVPSAARISSDLFRANGIEASVGPAAPGGYGVEERVELGHPRLLAVP